MVKDINFKTKVTGTGAAKSKIKGVEKTAVTSADKMSSAFKKMGGIMLAAFGTQQLISFGSEAIQLAAKLEGIKAAFDRLNQPGLLKNLREATRGTVTDLVLMQKAVQAQNFKIPLEQLATFFEFATKRAIQTGESVDFLVESIITGIGRKSVLVMDNLGISAVELQEEVKRVGDFGEAAGVIIRRELTSMGDVADTTTTAMAQLSAELENQQTIIGGKLAPVWLELNRAFGLFVSLATGGGPIQESLDEMNAKLQEQFKIVEKELIPEWIEFGGVLARTNELYEALGLNVPSVNKVLDEETTAVDGVTSSIKKLNDELELANMRLRGITTGFEGGGPGVAGAGIGTGQTGRGFGGAGGLGGPGQQISAATEAGLKEGFDNSVQMMEGVSRQWTATLESNFNEFWDSTFGHANSLLEQLLKMTFTGILSQVLSFLPGGGILTGIFSLFGSPRTGGGGVGTSEVVVLQIGDENIGTFVRKGNEFNRMRRLN